MVFLKKVSGKSSLFCFHVRFFSYFCTMLMKRIVLMGSLLVLTGMTAMAYEDHRGVNVDSLEAVVTGTHPPKGRELMEVYLPLVRAYLVRDGERCEHYARLALDLSYEIHGLNARETALYNLGLVAYGRDEWDTAIDYFQWALAVTDSMRGDRRYSQLDVDDNLSQLYGAIGNVYNMRDQLLLATEYYQRALPIFERNGWMESQTVLHHNVGELYSEMGNVEEAERHFLKAQECAERSGDSLMTALAQKGLTKIYLSRNDREGLRRTLLPAYAYYRAHRDEETGSYAEILASMARMKLMNGDDNDNDNDNSNVNGDGDDNDNGDGDGAAAQAFVDEALTYVERDMLSEQRCDIFAAAAEVAMARKQWRRALPLALQSVHPDSAATYGDAGGYVLLAHIYTELGEKDSARVFIDKVYRMMERFATEHYQSGLSQMEVLYESEKKQAAIDRLQEQRRWMWWGMALGGLVLVLAASLFFLLWRSVRLSRRTALVKAKLDGELEERVRLARDLHDRLGGLLTGIRMEVTRTKGMAGHSEAAADAADEQVVALVDDAIREMRNVSHHLLPDSLRRYGLRTALSDYCRTMPHVRFSFLGEERHVEHEEAIYCIVHELVNNAVKSSGASQIDVQLMAEQGRTMIVVADNGGGMEISEGQDAGPRTQGSQRSGDGCGPQRSGDGSGLENIRERLAAIGGSLVVDSAPGRGTEIHIEIVAGA